jgi:hypothetical protein
MTVMTRAHGVEHEILQDGNEILVQESYASKEISKLDDIKED